MARRVILRAVIGAAQLPCEGFVVRAHSRVTRREANDLGRDVAAFCAGRTKALAWQASSGDLYLSLTPVESARGKRRVDIAGHVVQTGGVLSAFESRTDRSNLQSFGDDLRVFPYGG